MNKQKWNWILDAIFMAGFLAAFFLDLTGLPLHQLLGIALGLLAVLHLALHHKWVESITHTFFGKCNMRARFCYLLDAAIWVGFNMIILTGLVISTWLNLPLTDYEIWKNIHVFSSIATLVVVVFKLAIHWRWIMKTLGSFFPRRPAVTNFPLPQTAGAVLRTAQTQPVGVSKSVDRRQFLALMGSVGLVSGVAIANVLIKKHSEEAAVLMQATSTAQPTATAITQPTAAATEATAPTAEPVQVEPTAVPTVQVVQEAPVNVASEQSCTVLCPRGCSYPGRCRRYVDANGNGLCDRGECL
jgi:hypothetical protein